MKRSEMVEILRAAVQESNGDFGWYDEERASFVLNILEKTGMLPPAWLKPVEFYDGKQYPLVPGDFKNEKGVWCTPGYHGWEPEESNNSEKEEA